MLGLDFKQNLIKDNLNKFVLNIFLLKTILMNIELNDIKTDFYLFRNNYIRMLNAYCFISFVF